MRNCFIVPRREFLYFANGQLMRQTDKAWVGRTYTDSRGHRVTEYRHATGQVQVESLTKPKRVA